MTNRRLAQRFVCRRLYHEEVVGNRVHLILHPCHGGSDGIPIHLAHPAQHVHRLFVVVEPLGDLVPNGDDLGQVVHVQKRGRVARARDVRLRTVVVPVHDALDGGVGGDDVTKGEGEPLAHRRQGVSYGRHKHVVRLHNQDVLIHPGAGARKESKQGWAAVSHWVAAPHVAVWMRGGDAHRGHLLHEFVIGRAVQDARERLQLRAGLGGLSLEGGVAHARLPVHVAVAIAGHHHVHAGHGLHSRGAS
mmetsp:Transcript_5985/g.11189  ORF Transcript_5985/g.11189 Transcript_5985/m.11189 type:complete len:247 (-) Transcript_5985:452-1192(-)